MQNLWEDQCDWKSVVGFRTKYINDSPKRADTDTYTIKAVNEHGEDEASLRICVICEQRSWMEGEEEMERGRMRGEDDERGFREGNAMVMQWKLSSS